MRELKFSVILPVYNVEKYLKQCLDSICASQENLEIIAVDDGSTDGSLSILQNYPDARLKVFHHENMGAFKTWQEGVRKSTGDYIVFVDPDDYIEPKLFADVKKILSERDYDLIQFSWKFLEGKRIKNNVCSLFSIPGVYEGEKLEKLLDEHLHTFVDLNGLFPMCRWGKVFKADAVKAFLPYLLKERIDMYEDDSFVLPFLTAVKSIYILNSDYYYYRCGRKGSICNSLQFKKRYEDCQKSVEFIENFGGGVVFAEKGKDYYFQRNYFLTFLSAIDNKQYAVAKEMCQNPRFLEKINATKGLKGYLWRHGKFGIFRIIRNIKLKLKGVQ